MNLLRATKDSRGREGEVIKKFTIIMFEYITAHKLYLRQNSEALEKLVRDTWPYMQAARKLVPI